jgi:hypothetical protein
VEDFSEMSNCQYEKEIMRRRKLPRLDGFWPLGDWSFEGYGKNNHREGRKERCEI